MEEELPLPPVNINTKQWSPVEPGGLSLPATAQIIDLLLKAKRPVVITSILGNNSDAVNQLVELAERLAIPVVEATPFAVNFPASHPLAQGSHWTGMGQNEFLAQADLVLVLDSDVPWIPLQNAPSAEATIIHIDVDPLKLAMPLFYIGAEYRYAASTAMALEQINAALPTKLAADVEKVKAERLAHATTKHNERTKRGEAAANQREMTPAPAAVAIAALRKCLPEESFIISEAISKFVLTHQLRD